LLLTKKACISLWIWVDSLFKICFAIAFIKARSRKSLIYLFVKTVHPRKANEQKLSMEFTWTKSKSHDRFVWNVDDC